MNQDKRLIREKKTVEAMIRLYCRKNHNLEKDLCEECSQILNYAIARLDNCPVAANKPTCLECEIHCYRKTEKETIRNIMKFSGPKMIFHHPYLAVMHLIDGKNRK